MMLAASTISQWDGFLELCGKLSRYVRFQAGDFYKMWLLLYWRAGEGFQGKKEKIP